MNKIYKVIFNHRLGNFVVVSELAKSCGKTQSVASEHPVSRFNPFSFLLKTLTAGILLALGTVQTVMAAESLVVSPGTTLTLVANGDGSYSITTNNNTTSVRQIETDPNRKTTYDTSLKLNGFGILQNRYDGPNELAGVPYLSGVGLGSDVTVGNADSIAIGRAAVAESFAHDNRKGAIALGANSKATKRSAIALGWNTRAMYSGAVAIGGGGKDTSARAGWDSISLGFNMNTEGARNTVGIGSKSTAQGEGNIFLASESSLKGKNNIVIGSQSKVNGQHNAGRSYEAPGAKYLGTDYQVWDDISNNVLIGARNTVNGGGSADFTTRNAVFGSNNIINAGVKDSVVIGSGVTVDASNTVYIGSGSQAKLDADESTAGEMGMTAFTDTEFTTIFGTTKFAGSGAKDRGVVTVGKQGAERLIQYVAPGLIDEKSTDAINGSQLYQVITHSLSHLRNLADTGFKLQTSGSMTANQAATTVKLGDTVQVVDGKNTRVSTITSNNGVHSYAINVDGLPMSFTDKDGNALVKVGDKFYKASDIGAGDTLVKVGDKLYKASALDDKGQPKSDATEITASTPAGVSLVDKDGKSTAQQLSGIKSSVADVEIKDDKGNVDKNASFTDKLAQAATDAHRKDNAVNVSDLNEVAKAAKDAQATADKGFNVKVSASGTGVASAPDDLKENGQNIKPGDTFTFEAGDNITLTQAQGKLTIATNNQGIVNNAQLPVAYTTTDKDGKQQKVYKGEDGQFYTVAGVNKDGNIVGKDGSVTSAKDKVVPTGNIITSVQNADGSVTNPSKLTNVADGAVAKGSKDAINGGQLYEYLGIKEGDDIQITQVTVNKPDGTTTVINVPTDKDGKPYLTTYNVEEQGEHITNNVYTAIRNMNEQGIKYFHVNAGQDIPEKQASNSEDSNASAKYAASIGYQANVESGAEGGLAIGKGATVTKDSVGSIAIGSGGKVSGKNSISIGSGILSKVMVQVPSVTQVA